VEPETSVVGRSNDFVADLYRAHYLSLVRMAIHLVDDLETAEDVVQDVFASLRPGAAQHISDVKRYLQTAVINRCRSALRRRRVARAFLPSPLGTAEAADRPILRQQEQARMLAALSRLPRRQKEVIVLRYYEDMPIATIADILRIKPGAVSSSLVRALNNLSSQLGDAHGH
jgi:RNA polymerase sigma factor (sigma-70 family)